MFLRLNAKISPEILEKTEEIAVWKQCFLLFFLKYVTIMKNTYMRASTIAETYFAGRYLRGMRASGIHVRVCVLQDGPEPFLSRRKAACGCSGMKKRGGVPRGRADGCGAGRNGASIGSHIKKELPEACTVGEYGSA